MRTPAPTGSEARPLRRSAIVALAIYAVLVGSLLTSLYDPLYAGRDDSWTLLVVLALAHVGMGAAVGRAWVLALPAALSIAGFLLGGAEGLAWLALLLGAPVLVGVTAAGMLLGRAAPRRRDALGLGFLAVALLGPAWAVVETARRGPHVPASVQRQLPTDVSLGNLCPGASDPSFERDVRRRAEVLIRELRRRPNDVVTEVSSFSDGSDERRDITVRELAEEQLADMESPASDCDPELRRRIRAAM
jgi:hypothetical protein